MPEGWTASQWEEQWEELYHSNTTSTIKDFGKDLGFGQIASTRIVLAETPTVLQELDETIKKFWTDFHRSRPSARNDPKLALRGREDVQVEGGVLLLRAFLTSYSVVRFKNSRSEEENRRLSDEQRDFLDNKFLTLGTGGYCCSSQGYLLGKRADGVARAGLIEYVPQGLVNPHQKGSSEEDVNRKVQEKQGEKENEDLLDKTLARELQEETGLDVAKDIIYRKATHINIGPKYGDFTLISKLRLAPQALAYIKPDPHEHSELFWKRSSDIAGMIQGPQRYSLTPVTAALFEKILTRE